MRKGALLSCYLTWESLFYSGVCVLLWMVPVFNRLHVESAAVLSFAAFFVAPRRLFRNTGSSFRRHLRVQLLWLLWPLALMSISTLWAPNCDYARGLGFFALFAPVTVFFSLSMAQLLKQKTRNGYMWLIVIGLSISILGPVFDIGLHPQFYTYNHVFGGVLGPIYDADLVVRPGLFVFRGLTIMWSLLFLALGERGYRKAMVLVFSIGGVYFFSGPFGINTPAAYLQSSFSDVAHTEHFDVYFNSERTNAVALGRLLDEHEFRYAELALELGEEPSSRIQSYVYPDDDMRARFTGARRTSVAPIWLRKPQIHVSMDSFYGVFAHELAHTFSREFGLPIVNASLSIGLVEGLAVALEPPDGGPTAHELVAAFERSVRADSAWTLASRLSRSLSARGFWGGRGSVSYTTTGSFVRFLLDTYGPASFKSAYANSSFEEYYQKSASELADEWQTMLVNLEIKHPDAAPSAVDQFSVLSLFETMCPHFVSRGLRVRRRASGLVEIGQIVRARKLLNEFLDRSHENSIEENERSKASEAARPDKYLAASLLRAEISLADADSDLIGIYLENRPDSVRGAREWLLSANYESLRGDLDKAADAYREVERALPSSDHRSRTSVFARTQLIHRTEITLAIASKGPIEKRLEKLLVIESESLAGDDIRFSGAERDALAYVIGSFYFALDEDAEALKYLEEIAFLHQLEKPMSSARLPRGPNGSETGALEMGTPAAGTLAAGTAAMGAIGAGTTKAIPRPNAFRYAAFMALQASYGIRDLQKASAYAELSEDLFEDDYSMLVLIQNWKKRTRWRTQL